MAFLCKSQRVYIIVLVIRWEWLSSYYITKEKSPSVQSVQSLSCVRLFATPWTAARQASLSITNFLSILSLMSIESVMSSNHLILCCPFFIHLQSFPAPGSFPMSQFFTSSGQHIGVSASNEYSGMISIRTDWLNLLTVQRTLKSLLQHHSSKASILWCSVFFIVQLSHAYMTAGKTMVNR